MSLVSSVLSGVVGLFTRQVAQTTPDGATVAKPEPKAFTRWAAYILYAALIYHFLLWPILSYHFPEYGFPPIDAALLSVLAGLGM